VTPIGSTPANRTNASTAVTVAPTTPSVYAVAAQRVQPESATQSVPTRSFDAANASGASVYDVSRGGTTMRR
jgi:hypothetical protein